MPSTSKTGSTTTHTRTADDAPEVSPTGLHNIPAQAGFVAGDGYTVPNPQLWPPNSQASGYGAGSTSYSNSNGDPRRRRKRSAGGRARALSRGSVGDEDDDTDDEVEYAEGGRWRGNGDREYSYRRRVKMSRDFRDGQDGGYRRRSVDDGQAGPQFRDPFYYRGAEASDDDYSDEDDNYRSRRDSRGDRGRSSSTSKMALMRRNSIGKVRQTIADVFDNSEDEKTGNTELKKWGATVAGALAGGLAAQQAGKKFGKQHDWVPAALGAFLGGFSAREAEKAWFSKKASKKEDEEDDDEEEEWQGNGYRGNAKRERSVSRGR